MRITFTQAVDVLNADDSVKFTIPAGEVVDWEPAHVEPYLAAGVVAPLDEEAAAQYAEYLKAPLTDVRVDKFVAVADSGAAADKAK